MIVLGYSLAIVMGLVLGMLGAGGSILTVPILVYFLKVKPVIATGYSLLVVGSAALFGSINHWRSGNVYLKTTLLFALPAMFTVLFTRTFIVPSIPASLLGVPKDSFIMMLFASLMLMSAIYMLKPLPLKTEDYVQHSQRLPKILAGGVGVGLMTGLVGAGGGFLIIPTLIAFFDLKVKEAIGTSLTVIAINSLVGFKGDIASGITFDWPLLTLFISLTFIGIALGTSLGKNIQAPILKKLFGVFVLMISILIYGHELYTL